MWRWRQDLWVSSGGDLGFSRQWLRSLIIEPSDAFGADTMEAEQAREQGEALSA